MKKLITIFLTSALLFSNFVSVYAVGEDVFQNDEIIEEYENTSYVNSKLTISTKLGTCKSIITGRSGVSKIVITQKLQIKSSDTWKNVDTWTKTFSSSSATYTNTKSSLSSGTYRTRTVAKVYKGSKYETVSANSSTVKI
jgi:hypothetical protein